MKARKMISSFEKGRLMSLLLFLLVSVTMQAENYDIIVAGTQVTSDNASNVLSDANATVSFDATTNTLTFDGADVDVASSDAYAVLSSITNLKICLKGKNVITTADNRPAFCLNGQSSGTLTFTQEAFFDDYGAYQLGSLVVKGLYQQSSFATGYSIGNDLIYDNIDPYQKVTGWHWDETGVDTSEKSVNLEYKEYYNLWLRSGSGSYQFDFDNLSPVSGGTTYNPITHTLHLENYGYEDAIVSGMEELIVEVSGSSNSPTSFVYEGQSENARLVFIADANSTTVNEVNISGSISGFAEVVIDESLRLASPTEVPEVWNEDITGIVITNAVDLSVYGTEVTLANAANVLGDGKVSYDAETNTLTLNGATIGNDGSNPEPMEAPGISYRGSADLTISLKGVNKIYGASGCEPIRRDAETAVKLIFAKGDDKDCSLQLIAEEGKTVISGGFSEIQGAWGIGDTDNGLAIIADKEVKYDSEDGLTIEKVVNYTVNYVPLSSTLITSYYGLAISGVPVYEGNKSNITGEGIYGNGTASFDLTTNTLTLNNVNLNPDYAQNDGDLRVSIVTSLAQLNINLIGESQTYAIKTTNKSGTLTFKSAEANRGAARLNFWYDAEPYYIGFGENKVTYNDGLCLRNSSSNSSFPKVVALYVPKVVTEEKERGLYYPDHEFTFSMEEEVEGFDIYYANMLDGDPVKTTDGKITLGVGSYVLRAYPIYPGMDTDPSKNSQFASEIYVKVIEKPTFTVADGTYNEAQNVKLQNIPEQDAREEWAEGLSENIMVPQVWYFINDNKNDSIRYDATKGISVTESCKVSVYVIDVDSAKKLKSTPVEAHYVIRQDAGLAYTQNNESVEVAEYTIGGEDNQDLPTLLNENEVAVTYSSEDEKVATVDATGEVTIVGMGETTITATSEETDELLAGEASYRLIVYKDLSHSDITVTLSELTYNGQPQTPTVTVKDGEVTLTLGEHYSIIEPEVGNTNAIEATAENAPVLNINCETEAEVNYYVGSRDVKFGIAPKQLEEDMVVLSATTLPYSGENQKPTVTVSDGEIMTADDYTITNEGGVAVGEYTVTVVAKNNYTGTVEKTFEIVNRTLEVGKDVSFVEGQKWASYYTTTEDLELPDGVMAYIVTAVGSEAVTVKAINYVPKNVPVLIEKESTATTENTSAEGNLLQGTTSAADVTAVEGTVYVLYNNGFTRAKSGSIPAGRAYLVLVQAAGARLSIFEETTGIDASLMNSEKRLVNDAVYDMQGRKVINSSLYTSGKATLKKGMYIVNGQKVVIK